MTTAAPSTALATIQPAFTDAERLALAGFLAGYRSLTREAMAKNPRRRLLLLKQRCGIGIKDDVTHGRSGQRGVPARPQIGQERRQLRIRLPDVGSQLPGISHRLGMLRPSEILDGRQLAGQRLRFLTRLAHDHHRTRPPRPGPSPSVASIQNQAHARAADLYSWRLVGDRQSRCAYQVFLRGGSLAAWALNSQNLPEESAEEGARVGGWPRPNSSGLSYSFRPPLLRRQGMADAMRPRAGRCPAWSLTRSPGRMPSSRAR